MNFTGANLSKLDLRGINFKYSILRDANLSGANLSYCNFERADLSHATIDVSIDFYFKFFMWCNDMIATTPFPTPEPSRTVVSDLHGLCTTLYVMPDRFLWPCPFAEAFRFSLVWLSVA